MSFLFVRLIILPSYKEIKMAEEIKKGKIVAFSYELKDDDGDLIEKSEQPLEYLHGSNNIIPGLEREMEGLKAGDTKNITVSPEEGYGEYDDSLVFDVPRENFPKEMEIEIGMEFKTDTDDGEMIVVVNAVTDEAVEVDGNHPLAGENLHFSIKVEGVRDATPQELQHGHAHHDGHNH